MPTSLHDSASMAFADLLQRQEMNLVDEADELHIIADEWTLVIQGDPPTSVLIALDDESGEPAEMLAAALTQDGQSALRALDSANSGQISMLLAASPDPLAQALATLLQS